MWALGSGHQDVRIDVGGNERPARISLLLTQATEKEKEKRSPEKSRSNLAHHRQYHRPTRAIVVTLEDCLQINICAHDEYVYRGSMP